MYKSKHIICFRILKDHTDSSGVHGQALDSLKQKLGEVEGALKREQDALKKIQVMIVIIYCNIFFITEGIIMPLVAEKSRDKLILNLGLIVF